MDSIVISHIPSSAPQYLQVWELRERILRQPIGLSLKNEDLSNDHTDTIFIAEHSGRVMACLMLHRKDDKTVQLRQMAVDSEWQGGGVGKMLVKAAEKFSETQGYDKIILHARKTAVGFYEQLGYTVTGDEFTEVGISHFLMEKGIGVNK